MTNKTNLALLAAHIDLGDNNTELTQAQVDKHINNLSIIHASLSSIDSKYSILFARKIGVTKRALKLYIDIVKATTLDNDTQAIYNASVDYYTEELDLANKELAKIEDMLRREYNLYLKPYKPLKKLLASGADDATVSIKASQLDGEAEDAYVTIGKEEAKQILTVKRYEADAMMQASELYAHKLKLEEDRIPQLRDELTYYTKLANCSIQQAQAVNAQHMRKEIKSIRDKIKHNANYTKTRVDFDLDKLGIFFSDAELDAIQASENMNKHIKGVCDKYLKYQAYNEIQMRALTSGNFKLYKELGDEGYKAHCDMLVQNTRQAHRDSVKYLYSKATPDMVDSVHKLTCITNECNEILHTLNYIQYITYQLLTLIDVVNPIEEKENA